jgi:parallel beta-helix repeat protein
MAPRILRGGEAVKVRAPVDVPGSLVSGSALGLSLGLTLLLAAPPAGAFPGTLNDWQARYGATSESGDNAGCQLCHGNANGGSPWNAYGWDILLALDDAACDLDQSGSVSNAEAFFCLELEDSDADPSGTDNVTEIGLGTQPGWTLGPFNTLFTAGSTIPNQPPPDGIGPIDPDGTEPPPPPPPPPPSDDLSDLPPGQLKRRTIVVRPGQSIQAAIDRARPGTTIYVQAGVYRETADPTNGLNITKNGIRLIGQNTPRKRVVLENAGNQRNGIVVVPEDRADCMGCHASMAPPFELLPGVQKGLKMREPMMTGIEIRGITIQGFVNNGLFTENVDGFRIVDVSSVDNKNYGIFPTLSRNGLVTHSYATGANDSGIWVETSENVRVSHNLVEGNVNGFEVSNSDDILLVHNEARKNTVGMAILLLPDIFDDRPGAKRIDTKDNWIHDNNKDNTARPGSILSSVPKGLGILHLGVDDSLISGNLIENNDFGGIGVVDYCLAVGGSDFDCFTGNDPTITPGFLADQSARNNRVVDNVLVGNGTKAVGDLAFLAADLTLFVSQDNETNCYEDNLFTKMVSSLGFLPACP